MEKIVTIDLTEGELIQIHSALEDWYLNLIQQSQDPTQKNVSEYCKRLAGEVNQLLTKIEPFIIVVGY